MHSLMVLGVRVCVMRTGIVVKVTTTERDRLDQTQHTLNSTLASQQASRLK